MTKRELAICCAILERRGLRYRPQPGSTDGQAGVALWFVTPGGIPIEVHAGSMWGFWTFLKLGQDRVGGARWLHLFALMEEEPAQPQDEEEREQALWDESHGAGPQDSNEGIEIRVPQWWRTDEPLSDTSHPGPCQGIGCVH
jgi:hypothetical protein